jgi:large subunit ribosomal protein L28
MANRCQICGKEPHSGYQFTRRGLAKSKGGVGRKTTGHTKRTFLPNLQVVKTATARGVRRVRVCAKCLRSGKVIKAG